MRPPYLSSARRWLTAAALCALIVLPAARVMAADGAQLDPEVLKKVKAATVHFKVTLSDGRVTQGSGFFTDDPGLIITNAHVLQMLDADSRKPTKVEVTINSGTDMSRTLVAKVLGVDTGSDLALVRVEDKEPPAPLKFGSTKTLNETQTVYVFGYPFGQQLGKEITVGKSSISSLRKNGENVASVQLDGGLNPGNSGGPIVDSMGNVIGVAVSGVRGTQIGSAIPAEYVNRFLNGRITSAGMGLPYKDGDKVMMEVTLTFVDPLGRLKKAEFEFWSGNPGNARPASAKQPAPLPGDSEKKRYEMTYEKKSEISLVIPLPPLADAKQVYWMQPIITNGSGETRWAAALPRLPIPPLDRRAITLKYKPPVNGKQTGEVVSNGDFRIRNEDGEPTEWGINLTAAFTETFADELPKSFPMRLTYDRFGMSIKLNNKPYEKDADLRKMQTDIRFAAADVEMDKDASIAVSKADLKKVPKASQAMISDMSDQILQSLELLAIQLPVKKIEPLDTWKVQRPVEIGSAIVSVGAQADITYTYMGVQLRDGKEGAVIGIEGRVKGRKGEGLDMGGTVNGTAFVSLETGEVVSGSVTVKADADLTYQRKKSKAIATLAVSVKRPAPPPAKPNPMPNPNPNP